jgi:hypothetical protein
MKDYAFGFYLSDDRARSPACLFLPVAGGGLV